MNVLVDVATAVICFASQCYPALVGVDTPRGEFTLAPYSIKDPKYNGSLLVFKIEPNKVFAIHQILNIPGQQRLARIFSPHPEHRTQITNGCINVAPETYALLMDCCSTSQVTIK